MLGYNKALDDAGVGTDDAKRTSIEVPPLTSPKPPVADQAEAANDETNANAAPDHLIADPITISTTSPEA